MPSPPPLSTTFILQVNLYWLLTTLVAWSLCCGLVGYMVGYLWGRPKYIILHESDILKTEGLPFSTELSQREH